MALQPHSLRTDLPCCSGSSALWVWQWESPCLSLKNVRASPLLLPPPLFDWICRSKLELHTNGKLEWEGIVPSMVFETNYKPERVKPPWITVISCRSGISRMCIQPLLMCFNFSVLHEKVGLTSLCILPLSDSAISYSLGTVFPHRVDTWTKVQL